MLGVLLLILGIVLIVDFIISCLLETKSLIGCIVGLTIFPIKMLIKKRKEKTKDKNMEVSLDLLPEHSIIRLINTGETEEDYIKRNIDKIRNESKRDYYSETSKEYMYKNGTIVEKNDGIYVRYVISSCYTERLISFYYADEIEYFLCEYGKKIGYYNGMSFKGFVKIFNINI